MKKASALLLVLMILMCPILTSCGSAAQAPASSDTSSAEASVSGETLNLAYQYGLAYAPAIIAQEQGFIEAAYKEQTGKTITIEWNQMSSGADVNSAITAGDLDAGFMGIPPAINAATKKIGIKIFSNLSGQEHGFMVNDPSLSSLGDIVGSDKQITLVNLGSTQHIMLAKALVENGFDAHALDANIVAMKQPDGLAALESGSVVGHVTSPPYLFKEQENTSLHELPEVKAAYAKENSFIVGVASEKLKTDKPDAYLALCNGIKTAIDLLNNDPEKAAEILHELDSNSVEVELDYIKRGIYTAETNHLFDIARFMYDNGFIDNEPKAYEELVFDNVKGN